MASAICADEGFAANRGKTRIMRQGDCQRITGLIVNPPKGLRLRLLFMQIDWD